MSTIGSVGSASSAWSGMSTSRAGAMKEKMFAKVDADGSGGVDATELQTMLDKVASKSGSSTVSASDLLSQADSDGDGSLSKDELDTGMKSLMPQPSSTMQFAQQRGMDGGPPPGPPPEGSPSGVEGSSSTSGTSSTESTETDPLDTNGDGVVSASEQLAGDLQALVEAMDGDGDGNIAKTEVETFLSQLQSGDSDSSSGSSTQIDTSSDASSSTSNSAPRGGHGRMDLAAMFSALVNEAYGQVSANGTSDTSISLAA
jgi:Ca2+-binding EF-hand superfamily protein